MATKKAKAKTVKTISKSSGKRAVEKKEKGKVNVNVKVKKTSPKKASSVKKAANVKKAVRTTKAKTKSTKKNEVLKDKQSRADIFKVLAESVNLTKVQVETVFDSLKQMMEGHLRNKGSGEFTIPKTGIKILRVKKKASKARKMVSPLTGEEVTIAAKPARNGVKITALKTLKEMVEK